MTTFISSVNISAQHDIKVRQSEKNMAIMFDGCDTPTYQMRSLVVVDQRRPSDQIKMILYIKIRMNVQV